ncbi:VOC family protein [Actinokineospora sp. NBRC 105648]|uniref:VOC family protein n=1 Tax=Actinokineospora sp. NBRC 105648 TaxID=3032206 RepID=UPI0025556201|nr:VOC family protein [Actinokineospora sp. NBRC 105648]
MPILTTAQPPGTPTWLTLATTDLDAAMAFHHALFSWDFAVSGGAAVCLLDGRPVAALTGGTPDPPTWTVHFATEDCAGTAASVVVAGGRLVAPVREVDGATVAEAEDPTGARFGLWQARGRIGCEVVNEPNSLVRNDLATPDAAAARAFYAEVFDFTLDGNQDLPDFDFTFLRRRDGHEIGGIFANPGGSPFWNTTFEVADTDEAVARAVAAGATTTAPEDMVYGRIATVTAPWGTEISVIARP